MFALPSQVGSICTGSEDPVSFTAYFATQTKLLKLQGAIPQCALVFFTKGMQIFNSTFGSQITSAAGQLNDTGQHSKIAEAI